MRIHVVGIGGAGMSAIARLLRASATVSGSDQGRWPLAEALRPLGVTVHDQFAAVHVEGADIVLRSSAYGEDQVEVAAARARGIPVWTRQDAWRFLARDRRVLAVAGTHGKTTTTAMAWCALRAAGVDASLICGAVVRGHGSNAHLGRDDLLVIEADEYDRAFQALQPEVAIVTNVDHDHVDLYPTPEDYAGAFRTFVGGMSGSTTLIACADDPGAGELAGWARAAPAGPRVLTYGARADADRPALTGGLRVPGAHNRLNATAALAAAAVLGLDERRALTGLAAFEGTERRLEELGRAAGVIVIDDYAHHPAEIRASIAAVRQPGGRVVIVFQPHTPSRLGAFFDDFSAALRTADAAVVSETFASARERPDARGGAADLAREAGATYAADPERAAAALAGLTGPGDTVLVLGAGDIRAAGLRLLELLRERVQV